LSQRTDVRTFNGSLGGTETQTDILVPSSSALARLGGLGLNLGVKEDVRLLLESTLRLDGQLGGPVTSHRSVCGLEEFMVEPFLSSVRVASKQRR
jgi:hypothetical protein